MMPPPRVLASYASQSRKAPQVQGRAGCDRSAVVLCRKEAATRCRRPWATAGPRCARVRDKKLGDKKLCTARHLWKGLRTAGPGGLLGGTKIIGPAAHGLPWAYTVVETLVRSVDESTSLCNLTNLLVWAGWCRFLTSAVYTGCHVP